MVKEQTHFVLLAVQKLVKEVDILPGKLDELREWCPVQGCRGNRDDAVNSLWGQVGRLRRCAGDLLAHSVWRGEEWIRIRKSVSYIISRPDVMRSVIRILWFHNWRFVNPWRLKVTLQGGSDLKL